MAFEPPTFQFATTRGVTKVQGSPDRALWNRVGGACWPLMVPGQPVTSGRPVLSGDTPFGAKILPMLEQATLSSSTAMIL